MSRFAARGGAGALCLLLASMGCGPSRERPAPPHATPPAPSPADPAPVASSACVAVGSPRVLATGARTPAVALGRGGALVVLLRGDPAVRETRAYTVLAIAAPFASGAATEVLTGAAIEPARDQVQGPFFGRLGDDAAVVTCRTDDMCADEVPGTGCEAWSCDLRVCGRRDLDAHFGVGRQLVLGPDFDFAGETVFGAGAPYQGGAMPNVMGFVVWHGRATRVLLHSFPTTDDAFPGTDTRVEVRALDAARALVSWTPAAGPDAGRTSRVLLTAAGRAPAIDVPPAPPVPLAFAEVRGGRAPPRLRATRGGTELHLDGLDAPAGRFAPTTVDTPRGPVVVFSEGLNRTTRIRVADVDLGAQRIGAPLDVSSPGVEAGRASAAALGDEVVVVWEERRDGGWSVLGASVRCARRDGAP